MNDDNDDKSLIDFDPAMLDDPFFAVCSECKGEMKKAAIVPVKYFKTSPESNVLFIKRYFPSENEKN